MHYLRNQCLSLLFSLGVLWLTGTLQAQEQPVYDEVAAAIRRIYSSGY